MRQPVLRDYRLGLVAVLMQPVLAFLPDGWVYFSYPWAYDSGSGDWHWVNTDDTQWVVSMRTGACSRLGESTGPSLASLAGTWTGTNRFVENISAILASDA